MPRVPTAPEQVLQRLDWFVVRRLDGLLQGDYRTLFYGSGLELADLREYQVGDDIRYIDWNVTARMGAPYVRQFVAERELTGWLLLDRSPSMEFGVAGRPKNEMLVEFVATMARLLTRAGNKVGAVLYNNAVEQVIEPRSGRNQVLRITRALMRPAENLGTTTDLGGLLRAGANVAKRRSLVFVVSDFLTEAGWEKPLALLAQRHEVVAVRLTDRAEHDLPDAGVVVLQDAETGEQLFVDTGDPRFRRRFKEAAAAREDRIAAAVRRSGVPLYGLGTDEDLVRALVRMLELHKRRPR